MWQNNRHAGMVGSDNWRNYCRDIPDYPKKGVMFRDITNVLKEPRAFSQVIDELAKECSYQDMDLIASMEARGLILGSAVAYKLNKGFIPVRKAGKLPWKTYSEEYDLEYGKACVEIHQDAVQEGQKVLIIDDVLATGGTTCAAIKLLSKCGAIVTGAVFLIELKALKGREKINVPVLSLVRY